MKKRVVKLNHNQKAFCDSTKEVIQGPLSRVPTVHAPTGKAHHQRE